MRCVRRRTRREQKVVAGKHVLTFFVKYGKLVLNRLRIAAQQQCVPLTMGATQGVSRFRMFFSKKLSVIVPCTQFKKGTQSAFGFPLKVLSVGVLLVSLL